MSKFKETGLIKTPIGIAWREDKRKRTAKTPKQLKARKRNQQEFNGRWRRCAFCSNPKPHQHKPEEFDICPCCGQNKKLITNKTCFSCFMRNECVSLKMPYMVSPYRTPKGEI